MNPVPLREGDFVWCAYPEPENPAQPGPPHLGYTLAATLGISSPTVFLAYTTSQPWPHERTPLGWCRSMQLQPHATASRELSSWTYGELLFCR